MSYQIKKVSISLTMLNDKGKVWDLIGYRVDLPHIPLLQNRLEKGQSSLVMHKTKEQKNMIDVNILQLSGRETVS